MATSNGAALISIAEVEVSGFMEKPVIVIVDDDLSVRVGTTDLLGALGFSAETFESAEDFLNSEIRSHTSCLVANVQMFGMSGIEVCQLQLAAQPCEAAA